MTLAELRLWHVLKGNRLSGLPFRRQQPILGFIVDFYCHRLRLVIEIDGAVYEQMANRDLERDAVLTDAGMTILHFRNERIFHNLDQVLSQILESAGEINRKVP